MRTPNPVPCAGMALALSLMHSPAAHADLPVSFSGLLTGSYGNAKVSGTSADIFGGGAAGAATFGEHWNIGANADYQRVSTSGLHANDWLFGAAFFWKDSKGRIGPVGGYETVDTGKVSGHVSYEGAGGEWWMADDLTLGLKGGGFNASGAVSGYYVGTGFTAYWQRDVDFTGSVDYAHGNSVGSETDYTMQGEWLVSERAPVSLFGGYTYADVSGLGTGHVNVWFLGVRLYTNGDGSRTLVDRQRNGPMGWTGAFHPVMFAY